MAIGRADTRLSSLYRIQGRHVFMQLGSLARSGAGDGIRRSKADSCPDGCMDTYVLSVFGPDG